MGIDYERLYDFRFRDVAQSDREEAWHEISSWLSRALGTPQRVLDPAAGRGEFIRTVPAAERWAVDQVDQRTSAWDPEIRFTVGDTRTVELPREYFDAVFVSNLLEHFTSQDDVADFLTRLRHLLRPGGRIAVLGPNFKYCARHYFDCADHTLALSHIAVAEHLYAAGYELERVIPKFLPFSFRGRTPSHPLLVRAYLHFPPAWRLLGRQFLLIARAPGDEPPAKLPSTPETDR